MRRIDCHHFASPFAPYFLEGGEQWIDTEDPVETAGLPLEKGGLSHSGNEGGGGGECDTKWWPQFGACHRVLQGVPPRGRQPYFTFSSAPDPLFKASKAPFLTLRIATPSGAPRQAPIWCMFDSH